MMKTLNSTAKTDSPPGPVLYTDADHRIWGVVYDRLTGLHHEYACRAYLQGWDALGLSPRRIPELAALSDDLEPRIGWTVLPVAGLVDVREFLVSLGRRRMLSTQYIRDGANPEYTPEPDIVHEIVGHVPLLFDGPLNALLQLFGDAAEVATPGQMVLLGRLYWYTVEFGLLEEGGALKAWGAGLLSSIGEMPHAFSAGVTRLPFDAARAAHLAYDHTIMQPTLFVTGSLDEVFEQVRRFLSSPEYQKS
jgi:phenylalanine-4-hydroxylase